MPCPGPAHMPTARSPQSPAPRTASVLGPSSIAKLLEFDSINCLKKLGMKAPTHPGQVSGKDLPRENFRVMGDTGCLESTGGQGLQVCPLLSAQVGHPPCSQCLSPNVILPFSSWSIARKRSVTVSSATPKAVLRMLDRASSSMLPSS